METLIQFFTANEWTWLHTASAAAGALIVWLLARWKSLSEIQVLRTELATRQVSLFEKMIALDEKQRTICRNLNEQLRQMLQLLKSGDAKVARQYREEVATTFLLDYIGSYFHYGGLGKWVYQDNKAELIDDELIPFLETSADVLSQLNRQDLLELTNVPPVRVQDFDFQFAIRYIRRHTPYWHLKRRGHLNKTVKRLFG